MADLGKVKGAGGVEVDMQELMHRWVELATWDSDVTGVRQAVEKFKHYTIDDRELKALQMKIRQEKGRLRKNFPTMNWYFK